MAAVSFLLKEPSAVKPTPIFAFISFNGQRVKVYTGLSILPEQWLKNEKRAQTRDYPANAKLNDALELASQQLLDCYRSHRAQGLLPDAAALRAAILPVPVQQVALQAACTFWQHLDEWVGQKRASGRAGTARTYATARRHLREFSRTQGYVVNFDTITPSFGDKFTAYLVGPANLADNTVLKVIARVKRFMKWAEAQGLHTNNHYTGLTWGQREPAM